ncbi:hypothetical protein FOZ62_002859 [Perkinsus olseni]|uniref:TIR domain-containing protein n=2 Tax=Perkinsus olseni TaxID=32597 RepID=A0A7J6UBK9_PEROL|nr:hypothetical protein FOZ62_002859 [Perkinsus olseni]
MVFLDKCCIPQKDPIAKSYGISKLADYLRASDKLLILWSPDYLDRLWCVYELAVFLQTHDEDDVILVNLDHLKLCVSLMLLQFFSILISGVTEFCGYSEHIGFALSLASSFLIGRGAFVCGEEWQKFCSRVKCFSVHKAKCSSLADYSDLKQLITDFYGSEAEFAAVVKRLWLGEGEGKHLPEWLFAGASLRIISAPYAPVIVCFAVQYIICGIRGGIEPSVPIYPPGVPYEPLPGKIHTMLWMSRLSIIPVLMLCFRAPLMLLVGHKLATTGWISEKVDKWCRGIAFATCFGVYNCLTQMICGLRIFNHPLYWPAISGLTNEASLFVCGIVVVTTVSLILRRSYAYELLRDSS